MLDKIDFFQGLTDKELSEVAQIAKKISFGKDEIIFSQGDFSRDFYIIENGQVEIFILSFLKEKKTLAVLKNGDFFGEMALFDPQSTRSASARSLQQSTLMVIKEEDFEILLKEKPNISFKIFGSMSKRLKDANMKSMQTAVKPKEHSCKILSVASPRNGAGKSIFASTMAHLFEQELLKRTLFFDMDFLFAEGTFYMGVSSPRSILDFQFGLKAPISFDELEKILAKSSPQLYSVPGPSNYIDGERISTKEILDVINACKPHFDYIIIDTDSQVNDILLNIFDLSDHIIFLLDLSTVLKLKSNSRYFQAIYRLNIAEEKIHLFASRTQENFDPEKYSRIFKYRLIGALPEFPNFMAEFGKSIYRLAPESGYCEFVRQFGKSFLKENFEIKNKSKDKNILYRFLFPEQVQIVAPDGSLMISSSNIQGESSLTIEEDYISSLFKFIHFNIIYGFLEEGRQQAYTLVEMCPNSSQALQLLGEILTAEINYPQAIEVFQKAVYIDPENHLAIGYLSMLCADSSFFAKATEILSKKIKKNPLYPDLHSDQGKILALHQKHPEACSCFKRALEINPDYLEVKINLSISLKESGKIEKAIETLRAIHPKNIRVFFLLGHFYFVTQKLYESFDCFQKVQETRINYFDTSEMIRKLNAYFSKINTLVDMHLEMARKFPNFADIHFKLGNFSLLLGKKAEALAEFETALRINPAYFQASERLNEIKAKIEPDSFEETLGEEKKEQAVRTHDLQIPLKYTFESPNQLPLNIQVVFDEKQSNEIGKNDQSFLWLRIKDIRTKKVSESPLSKASLSNDSFVFHGNLLENVFPEDLLLIEVYDKQTGEVLVAVSHSVNEKEIQSNTLNVSFDINKMHSWSLAEFFQPDFHTAIHNFCILLHSESIGNLLSKKPDEVQVKIVNPRNKISAEGKVNPADLSEIYFRLSSKEEADVVIPNDQLKITFAEINGPKIFEFEVSVLKENIQSFCKEITLDLDFAAPS
ncbi:MAG: cyclic nucleotide-binding domain-containing protein [Candidatus Riflebacteria bacterium]|nr:cyclic nucleotide-binding domain-containing protein [Candidatus Riflebacteria bacterium]